MATKVWKEKAPGREQLELERMLKCKEIDPRDNPDSAKQKSALFKDFSATVFGNHFRKTKAKLGLCATVANANEEQLILELGGLIPNERSISPPGNASNCSEPVQAITQSNSPCWTWIYTDHQKKKDFVCVAIPALCGKNAKCSISEDGTKIKIKYDWPEVMFKANKLFEKSLADNGRRFSLGHPKVHAFVSHLLESGVTEHSTLQADITIDLPRQVQRENDSWSIEKVFVGDSKMILLEFSAFQKALIINDADTSLDF